MEFALILRELSRRKRALAVGVLIAAVAATLSVYRLDGLSLKSRSLQHSSATTTVFVDTPASVLGNLTQNFEPLQARATAYANFMASPTLLDLIGRRVGLAGGQLYAAGPVDVSVPRVVEEPTAVQRNVEITGETDPYRLNFNNDPNLPTIGIYAQAPTTSQSVALANAAAASLAQYVTSLQSANHTPPQSRVVVRQLGPATGGVSDGGISKTLASMVFLVVFLFWCVLILVSVRFREYWRASARLAGDADPRAPEPQLTLSELERPQGIDELDRPLGIDELEWLPGGAREAGEVAGRNAEHEARSRKARGERAPEPAGVSRLRARIRPSGP